ncbi:hypothetical protein ILYODFUR_015914 [Ilyodon furcidens]|uniref:Uncharacterized protein n=1 Tax=Ilyodon furcidens TaxID=33524 RepID=A0ABV0V3F7_9TELE
MRLTLSLLVPCGGHSRSKGFFIGGHRVYTGEEGPIFCGCWTAKNQKRSGLGTGGFCLSFSLGPSSQDLQHELGQFAAECKKETQGMAQDTLERLCLSNAQCKEDCNLLVGGLAITSGCRVRTAIYMFRRVEMT